MSVKHKFVSAKADGGDATLVRPSNWNDEHDAIKQTEIDFGTTPVADSSFTITDADVAATDQIVAQVAYEAPTGKDLDEIEMDTLSLRCGAGAGQFTLFATGMDGYVADKFKINYIVG